MPVLPARPSPDQQAILDKWIDEDNRTRCYILTSMSHDLQCLHKNIRTTKQILTHLQKLYDEQSRTARFEVTRKLFRAKMRDGQSMHDHCLIIIKDIEELHKLRMNMDKELLVGDS
ncbi:uncharacterized protein [Elaeis guineensis]|uniref:uncharacterized protein n=1 Tax=Elaeis guineensis var. tenera TaxID=51953 RepID=UPI003C6D2769